MAGTCLRITHAVQASAAATSTTATQNHDHSHTASTTSSSSGGPKHVAATTSRAVASLDETGCHGIPASPKRLTVGAPGTGPVGVSDTLPTYPATEAPPRSP